MSSVLSLNFLLTAFLILHISCTLYIIMTILWVNDSFMRNGLLCNQAERKLSQGSLIRNAIMNC